MIVQIRLYRRFDLDLIGLWRNGYPIGPMVARALEAYVYQQPIQFTIQSNELDVFPETREVHTALTIRDAEIIMMLKQIRPKYRNAFCKALLRMYLPRDVVMLTPYHMTAKWQKKNLRKTGLLNLDPYNLIPTTGRKPAGVKLPPAGNSKQDEKTRPAKSTKPSQKAKQKKLQKAPNTEETAAAQKTAADMPRQNVPPGTMAEPNEQLAEQAVQSPEALSAVQTEQAINAGSTGTILEPDAGVNPDGSTDANAQKNENPADPPEMTDVSAQDVDLPEDLSDLFGSLIE